MTLAADVEPYCRFRRSTVVEFLAKLDEMTAGKAVVSDLPLIL